MRMTLKKFYLGLSPRSPRRELVEQLAKVTKLLDIIVCGGIIELAADIFLRKCYKAVIFCCDNVAFFAHKEDLETLLIGIENRCKFLYDTMSL